MRRICVYVLSASLSVLVGCKHIEPSPIVTAFHNASGGDVDQSSPDSIAQFLSKHEDLRTQLTPLCTEKKAAAPADWATTDEGKICAGNTRANFFGKTVMKSDGVAF
jgi:hypothetical protein